MKKLRQRMVSFLAVCLLLTVSFATPLSAVSEPEVPTSKTALLYCVESDTVLYENNTDAVVYPAALVKLMTALVAVEEAEAKGLTPDTMFTASRLAVSQGNLGLNIGLKLNEKLSF